MLRSRSARSFALCLSVFAAASHWSVISFQIRAGSSKVQITVSHTVASICATDTDGCWHFAL
jgi:hypothetical protein